MEELIKIMNETIQNSAYAAKLLIAAEIAMNDGELETSQKNTKEAQSFIKTMTKDVFVEFAEESGVSSDDTNDYDIPTTLELAKQLTQLQYDLAILLGLIADGQNAMFENVEKTIQKDINTVTEIFTAIFEN